MLHLRYMLTRILFIMSILYSTMIYAQSGNISGKVLDSTDNSPLWGTNILILGTSLGTTTDLEGHFRLPGIQQGSVTLIFRYLGYETDTVTVEVTEDKTTNIDIMLKPEAIEGEEIVVTAQFQGQQAAINQQLTSNTIVNIVSKDKIQELPDANAAESVGRLPGVSIERDAGEGTKVVVRGLSPKFNSITVNGERIPATDGEDRSVDLSMISSEMLEGIEVFKALTPDKDGDAVGGTVNFVIKKAPTALQGSLRFEGGYNNHENDYGNYKGSFSVSNRFFEDKLGVLVTGNLQKANRSSDVLDASYLLLREKLPNEELAPVIVDNLNLGDRKETRKRYGGNITLDYQLPNGNIMLSSLYSKTDRNEVRMRKRYRVDDGYVEYWLRSRDIYTDLFTNSLSGSHDFDFIQVEWRASYSLTQRDMPGSHDSEFRETGAYNNSLVDDQGPLLIPAGAKNNLNETIFYQDFFDKEKIDDRDLTAQIDFKLPLRFGDDINSIIKLGGKYRDKSRERDKSQNLTVAFEIDKIGAENPDKFDLTRENKIKISNFIDPDYDIGEFLNGDYQFPIWLSQSKIDQFMRTYSNRYVNNVAFELEDYNAGESIAAGYLMAEVNLGEMFLVIPGFRYEYTSNNFQNVWGDVRVDEDGNYTVIKANDTTGSRTYGEILPMLHLRFKPVDWFDVRLAVTKSLSRPDYFDLVPWERITTDESMIERGNANLEVTKAWNYDLYFSFHNNYGLFTVGGFYKELKDIAYIRTSRTTYNNRGYTLIIPENSDNLAKVYGLEFDVQTNLRFLPSPLDGIVLSANYSLIESETYFPLLKVAYMTKPPFSAVYTDTVRKATMPGQADDIANISLGYEKGPFSGRISIVYQGASLQTIGTRKELDGYSGSFTRLDIAAQYEIIKDFNLIMNINNITNRSEGAYLGIVSYPTAEEYFGMTMDFGIKYKF